jgi:hypothetical protein
MLKRLLLLVIKSTSLDDVFTGSDWWMVHQITKRSVIDPEFAKWAGNVILVELDYPRRTPQALK